MSVFACNTLLFFLALPSLSSPFSFGLQKEDKPLYSGLDPGLTLVNISDFKSIVHGSKSAWMVEFFSSWCGHCIHFAPTFRHLAKDVQGWSNVISVAAIDCAKDENMPICRNYDIMGYPSLKFFPPNADPSDVGLQRQSHGLEVKDIKSDMHDFVARVEQNKSSDSYTNGWPVLNPFTSDDLSTLWDSSSSSSSDHSPFAVLMVHVESQTSLALDTILDFSETTGRLSPPFIVRRVNADTAPPELMSALSSRSMPTYPQLIVVKKDEGHKPTIITPTLTQESNIRAEFYMALKSFVLNESKALPSPDQQKPLQPPKNKEQLSLSSELPSRDKIVLPQPKAVAASSKVSHNEAELKRRRYTVYMSDLEKAMLYSLSHEASQHATIAGDSLNALQDYVDALARYFPARHKTKQFLEALRTWVMGHDDTIRGVDLSNAVGTFKSKLKAFEDTSDGWIGCAGSTAQYGGYPCGLWMMFHSMTVNQKKSDDPKTVLKAIKGFIEHFFGCRECARHFLQMAENGKAIEREVKDADGAVLWLWKSHNKVNLRLSGDFSDDELFPKEKYPSKQHCSDCYNTQIAGSDGWKEYRLPTVKHFLREMYTKENFSYDGLNITDEEDRNVQRNHHEHGLIVSVKSSKDPKERTVDTANYGRKANGDTTFANIFSDTDASLLFIVYFISSALIVLACVRFVAKKRLGTCLKTIFRMRRPSSPYSNPLLGKV